MLRTNYYNKYGYIYGMITRKYKKDIKIVTVIKFTDCLEALKWYHDTPYTESTHKYLGSWYKITKIIRGAE